MYESKQLVAICAYVAEDAKIQKKKKFARCWLWRNVFSEFPRPSCHVTWQPLCENILESKSLFFETSTNRTNGVLSNMNIERVQ